MSAKRNGVIIGFAAVVVVAILVIGYYSLHRPPAPPENAVGATGAAQRYKAEQIKEGDVRLDLKSQETLDEAIFAVLTEEQKADMLDRLTAERRKRLLDAINVSEAGFMSMDRKHKGALMDRAFADGRTNFCAVFQIDAAMYEKMDDNQKAELFERATADRRKRFLDAINVTEAGYVSLDRKHKAELMDRATAEVRVRDVYSAYCFSNMALERMPAMQQAAVWERIPDGGRGLYEKMGITPDEFQKYTMEKKANEMLRLSDDVGRRAIEDRPRRDRRE